MKEKLTITVMAYNKIEHTKLCIQSIIDNTPEPYELILVDNGSTDDTLEYFLSIKKIHPNTNILHYKDNEIVEEVANTAVQVAKGEFIIGVCNDVIVSSQWSDRLLYHMEDPQVGVVGPVCNNISGEQHIKIYFPSIEIFNYYAKQFATNFNQKSTITHRIVGMLTCSRTNVLKDIGGYDINLPTNGRDGGHGFSDDDISIRLIKAGYKLLIAHDVLVYHTGSATVGENWDKYLEGIEINRVKFLNKHTDHFRC